MNSLIASQPHGPPGHHRNRFVAISRLPGLILVVVITTLVPCFWGHTILGFNLSGWSWVIALLTAILMLLSPGKGRATFPWVLWIPWILLLLLNLMLRPHQDVLQRTLQILCPLVVGVAASTLRLSLDYLPAFTRLMQVTVILLLVSIAVNLNMVMTITSSGGSAMAPQAITAVLLSTYFFSLINTQSKGYIIYFAACLIVPFVTMVRGAIVGLAVSIVGSLSHQRLGTRIALALLIIAGGVAALSMPRFQKRMFRSGTGTIKDISLDNPNFDAGGRQTMWDVLKAGIRKSPWIGHGGNAHAQAIRDAGYTLIEPHNDWLRIAHDYGIPFAALFPLAVFMQIRHGLRRARRTVLPVRVLYFSGLTAFIPMLTLMCTDNVLVYAQYFGNLHFLWLGLAYGIDPANDRQRSGSMPPPIAVQSDRNHIAN